jgi:hypothetical protein
LEDNRSGQEEEEEEEQQDPFHQDHVDVTSLLHLLRDTPLYTVRGVGSGSRDVDTWCANGSVRRGSGATSTDDPGAWLPTHRHLQR